MTVTVSRKLCLNLIGNLFDNNDMLNTKHKKIKHEHWDLWLLVSVDFHGSLPYVYSGSLVVATFPSRVCKTRAYRSPNWVE